MSRHPSLYNKSTPLVLRVDYVDPSPELPYTHQLPFFHKKLKAYIKDDTLGGLSSILRSYLIGEDHRVHFLKVTKPFFMSLELPIELFNDILSYYCTIWEDEPETERVEIRSIRAFEYHEIKGIIYGILKTLSPWSDLDSKHLGMSKSFNIALANFVYLFTDFMRMWKYGLLLEDLEKSKLSMYEMGESQIEYELLKYNWWDSDVIEDMNLISEEDRMNHLRKLGINEDMEEDEDDEEVMNFTVVDGVVRFENDM